MTDAAKKLSAAAKNLSPAERVAVVDAILASLDTPDPKIDALVGLLMRVTSFLLLAFGTKSNSLKPMNNGD